MPENKDRDADVKAGPDRMPTPDEERDAERNELAESDEHAESVAEHEREMAKRGANQKGEGRIA